MPGLAQGAGDGEPDAARPAGHDRRTFRHFPLLAVCRTPPPYRQARLGVGGETIAAGTLNNAADARRPDRPGVGLPAGGRRAARRLRRRRGDELPERARGRAREEPPGASPQRLPGQRRALARRSDPRTPTPPPNSRSNPPRWPSTPARTATRSASLERRRAPGERRRSRPLHRQGPGDDRWRRRAGSGDAAAERHENQGAPGRPGSAGARPLPGADRNARHRTPVPGQDDRRGPRGRAGRLLRPGRLPQRRRMARGGGDQGRRGNLREAAAERRSRRVQLDPAARAAGAADPYARPRRTSGGTCRRSRRASRRTR